MHSTVIGKGEQKEIRVDEIVQCGESKKRQEVELRAEILLEAAMETFSHVPETGFGEFLASSNIRLPHPTPSKRKEQQSTSVLLGAVFLT